jgi:hypothetical protein
MPTSPSLEHHDSQPQGWRRQGGRGTRMTPLWEKPLKFTMKIRYTRGYNTVRSLTGLILLRL